MTTAGNDQGTWPATLERAAEILERRSLKKPPGILLSAVCRMLRKQATQIADENRAIDEFLRG